MISDHLRVFVSSSMEELRAERSVVKRALGELKIDAWVYEEDAGARPKSAQITFNDELERADLYLGIFWNKLGQYTRDEFELATSLGKDCLIYEKRSQIDGRERSLQDFLDRISHVTSGLTVRYFETADQLYEFVKQDVARWQTKKVRGLAVRRVHTSAKSLDSDERQAIDTMKRKVQKFWIDGVLERALQATVSIHPIRETRPHAVESPWEGVLDIPEQKQERLSAEVSQHDVFRELGASMLLLGAPGSGKTIALLQLVKEVFECTDFQAEEPVPVVFNLSTWSEASGSLLDWLVRELSSKYQIPVRIGQKCLENQRLMLMLDGLDEVTMDQQPACVQAINQYVEAVGAPGIVVCCRSQDYKRLPVRLKLQGAILLQDLEPDEVLQHVSRAGLGYAALAAALEQDSPLKELARSPLLLDVMMFAFRDRTTVDFATCETETLRSRIFDAYIARMFSHGVSRFRGYSKGQIIRTLEWIAHDMSQRSQSIFLIEGLQPSGLSTSLERIAYLLMSRGITGVAFGLIIGVSILLGVLPEFWMDLGNSPELWQFIRGVLSVGLIGGLLYSVLLTGADCLCLRARGVNWSAHGRWIYLGLLVPGLLFAGAVWSAVEIIDVSDKDFLGPTFVVLGFIAVSLIWGRRWLRQSMVNDINSVELLTWSWARVPYGASIGLSVGVAIAALMLSSMWPLTGGELGLVPMLATLNALSFGFVGALFAGVRSGTLESTSKPNQGMRLSIRNSIISVLGGTIVVSVVIALVFAIAVGISYLIYPNSFSYAKPASAVDFIIPFASMSIAAGLFVGACAAMIFGAVELAHHAALRIVLATKKKLPLLLIRILDQAASLVLMRSVGGGYIFIHRLLLEHFCASGSNRQQ